MRISPNNIHVKNVMENLMKEALIDITPANNEICLMMPQQNGGKANKRKRLNADKKFTKARSHVVNKSDEQKVCAKALECLSFLLVYHGVLMKPVLFYILQEKVSSIGFMIASRSQDESDLYHDPFCRSRLSDLIGFLMVHPVHKMPVPINYGLAMLTKMKNLDPIASVRDAAAMNLYRAESAIHNRKDVFYFPPDCRDLRDTLMFNKQTIQKFQAETNGQEKPAIDTNSKKPRREEVEDVEVVISDDSNEEEMEITEDAVPMLPLIVEPEVNEISDDADEPQEISDTEEPEIVVVIEKPKSPVKESPPVVTIKRTKKISNHKDDDLLEEYLADFSG